jgi:hypothetical protein
MMEVLNTKVPRTATKTNIRDLLRKIRWQPWRGVAQDFTRKNRLKWKSN